MAEVKVLSTAVIKRFLTESEYNDFLVKYINSKKASRPKTTYDQTDWQMFEARRPIAEFMEKWKVSRDRTLWKLGQMMEIKANEKK